MASKNNSYTKPEASRELLEIKEKAIEVPVVTPELNVSEISNNYIKHEGTTSSALFVIVSGGIERERLYFYRIANMSSFPRIRLMFVAESSETGENGLSPRKMYQVALNIKKSFIEDNTTDEDDNISLVADMDDFMPELLEIKPLCLAENLKLFISNSCFEVWLYYGKLSSKPTDFVIPTDPTKISSAFKTYLGNKVVGGVNPINAIFDLEQAIRNAEANYEEDENGIPCLFSSNLYILGKELLKLIQEELVKEKEIKAAKEVLYRRK